MEQFSAFSDSFGAIVAALVAWLTLSVTLRHEREKSEREADEKTNAVLGAIKTEIATLWPIYMEQFGNHLEGLKEGDVANEFPVGEGYFVVYESNAGVLGSVADAGLRNQIVRTYIRAHGMIDSIRLYNSLLAQAHEYAGVNRAHSSESNIAHQRWKSVRQYAMQLQSSHRLLRKHVEELLEMLKE